MSTQVTPQQKAYLEEALQACSAADTYAADFETTGFNPFADRITGFSVAVDTEQVDPQCVHGCCQGKGIKFPKAWYFQFVPELVEHLSNEEALAQYPDEVYSMLAVLRAFRPIFLDRSKRRVFHNAKFDDKFGIRAGIRFDNILIDTAIAGWLDDENRGSQKLKTLAKKLFGHDMVEFSELGGLFSPSIKLYGADDSAQTLRLWRYFEPRLEDQGLMKVFVESECRCARQLAKMELAGAKVDLDLISRMKREVHTELAEVKQEIYKLAGREFNIDSNDQLAQVLFKELKWPVYQWARTSTGKPSVNKKVIQKFEHRFPLAKALLKHSELTKLATGYTDPIESAAKRLDGRIRGRFNQIENPDASGGTVTGRLSASKDPDLGGVNLQTIPSRSKLGAQIRYMFVSPERRKLICLDYSQIELRFLAHLSMDELLIEAYCSWDCVECGATGSTPERLFVCPKCGAPEGHHKFEEKCLVCIEGQAKTGCPKHGFKQGKDVHQLTADQVGCTRKDAKCFHPDTEVLTRSGWVRIPDLRHGQEVMQAVPEDEGGIRLEWVVPKDVWTENHPSGKLIHLEAEGIDLRVTPDHRMLIWTGSRYKDFLASQFPGYGHFPSAGHVDGGKDVDEAWLRLAVATQADGNFSGGGIRFTFTKRRKSDRMHALLRGVNYSFKRGRQNGKTSYSFWILASDAPRIKELLDGKSFCWSWLGLSLASREVVLDEARHWDSHARDDWRMVRYSNCDAQSVDVLQAIAAVSGHKSRQVTVPQPGDRRSMINLSVKPGDRTQCRGVRREELDYTDKVACLTVDSSYVLVRDRGVPLICGQTINFAVVYGTGPRSLGEQIGASPREAGRFLDNYFKKYRGVDRFAQSICNDLTRRGYVTTILKRRRRIPEARRRHVTRKDRWWRMAMSARVQGSAADLMKVAIRNVGERFEKEGLDAELILTVHDELVAECAEDQEDRTYEVMQYEMENCFPLRVPVVAEGHKAKSWGEAK